MVNKIKNMTPKQKVVVAIIGVLIVAFITFVIVKVYKVIETPTLTLVPPGPMDVLNRDEFAIDVVLSDLGRELYPAASLTIGFDKNKLEFTGTKLGTMMTYGKNTIDGNSFDIPLWTCNTERANEIGEINTMYMDMTAGKYAYSKNGFDNKTKNVVLRLGFKLKDSAVKGEVYNIKVHDAVIAAINGDEDNTSLATSQDTLRARSCKIVINK